MKIVPFDQQLTRFELKPYAFSPQQSSFKPQDFRSTLECDLPTTKIYRFHGSILHPWGERVPVGKDNLLLRECVLKNTDFVEGLVVYAGHESKAMLNNGGPRYKRSKLERQMNIEIVWCVATLLVSLSMQIFKNFSKLRKVLITRLLTVIS